MVAGRKLHTSSSPGARPPPAEGAFASLKGLGDVFRYTRHALELVWSTSKRLTAALAVLTLLAGILPAGIAFVGAKIVDASTGEKATLTQCALRYIGYFISGAVLMLGYIWIGIDSRKRGWHDMIAGTAVVRAR